MFRAQRFLNRVVKKAFQKVNPYSEWAKWVGVAGTSYAKSLRGKHGHLYKAIEGVSTSLNPEESMRVQVREVKGPQALKVLVIYTSDLTLKEVETTGGF